MRLYLLIELFRFFFGKPWYMSVMVYVWVPLSSLEPYPEGCYPIQTSLESWSKGKPFLKHSVEAYLGRDSRIRKPKN